MQDINDKIIHSLSFSNFTRANMYFGLNDSLKSPKAKDQIVNFVQRINKTTMENYEKDVSNKSKIHEKMINKSISLLMVPGI